MKTNEINHANDNGGLWCLPLQYNYYRIILKITGEPKVITGIHYDFQFLATELETRIRILYSNFSNICLTL